MDNKISNASVEFREMDELAAGNSPIHKLHPLVKFIVTMVFIFVTVSFDKYDLSGIVPMVLFPIMIFEISGIPIKTCFHKLRVVMPLVCAVGLFNPFFDRDVMLNIGNIPVTGGVISMITLMLKGIFSLMASFILVATTPMDALCAGLRKLHIPNILVTLLLLTYRYISIMIEEVAIMTESYHLRAPGQKGIHISAWGSFLGQLLLRSMDRAEELYNSMQLRGFAGEFYYADTKPMGLNSVVYFALSIGFIALVRLVDVGQLLGSLFV